MSAAPTFSFGATSSGSAPMPTLSFGTLSVSAAPSSGSAPAPAFSFGAAPSTSSGSPPTKESILDLALSLGYSERRPEVSYTLFLGKDDVLVDIYYTKRGVKTMLDHPKQGKNQLFRRETYDGLDDLEEILQNPRTHTNKGYRAAGKARSKCSVCGEDKVRTEFSVNQWKKSSKVEGMTPARRCKDCTEKEVEAAVKPKATGGPPKKTSSTKKLSASNLSKWEHLSLERRQFVCPEHDRPFIFFKKVPPHKPVAKCPRCKRDRQAKNRWEAIPLEEEKGYGLFQCERCRSRWGSSRACRSFGQYCHNTTCQDAPPVKPLRIEVWRPKRGAPRRRAPPPVGENQVEDHSCGPDPLQPFGGTAGPGARYGHTESYDFSNSFSGTRSTNPESPAAVSDSSWEELKATDSDSGSGSWHEVPKNVHRCEGCESGACKDKEFMYKLPNSKPHESTGSTASTASVQTFSTVDDADFPDRDPDF